MTRQRAFLIVLGCLLVAGVGAVLWLGTRSDGPVDASALDEKIGVDAAEAADARAPGAATRRSRHAGTASVVGEVRSSKAKAAVVGQLVELVPERGEPYAAKTDARGAFQIVDVASGGPYELRVAAKGCGTVRIPGIALDPHEKRDVGTLWLDPAVRLAVEVVTWADVGIPGAVVEAYAVAPREDADWGRTAAQAAQVAVPVARVPTDAAGRAVFPDIAVGRYTFAASKDGFSRAGRTNVVLRSDVEPDPVRIRLGAGSTLTGRVVDSSKTPVAGAQILAGLPALGWSTSDAALRSRTTTDAEGRYTLTSIAAGDANLFAGRAGTVPALIATLKIPQVRQFDITLKGTGKVQGTVTQRETGKPVEAALVKARSWGGGVGATYEATTNAEGRYAMNVVEGNVGNFSVEKDGLALAEDPSRPQQQTLVREGETITRDIAMRIGAKLSGVVRGPDGPIAGARVSVQTPRGDGNQKPATTDAEGRYEFASLVPGTVFARPEKEGYSIPGFPDASWQALQQSGEAAKFMVELTAETPATRDFELARGGVVSGRVDGPDGPLGGVRVVMGGIALEDGTVTGADGTFRLEPVKPGTNLGVVAVKDGFVVVGAKTVDVVEGTPTSDVVIRMKRAAVVRGKVTTTDGAPLVDAQVRVGHGSDPGPWYFQTANPPQSVKPDGTYEISLDRSDGRFRVMANATGRAFVFSDSIALLEDKSVYTVDIALDAGRDFEGVVVSKRGGAPIAGASVAIAWLIRPGVTWGGGDRPVWTVTDSDGHFNVTHVQPGQYDVYASAPGYVGGNAVFDVTSANRVTVELEPELTIEGTVAFADGTPAEGANLNVSRVNPGDGSEGRQFGFGRGNFFGGGNWAVTGKGGAFRVASLVGGSYRIRVSGGGDLNIRPKDTEPIAAGSTAVKIVVDAGGVIAGVVTDAKGRPIAYADVSARADQPGGGSDGGLRVNFSRSFGGGGNRGAQSQADGTFSINGLGTGTYTISVSAGNWNGGNLRPFETKGVPIGTSNLAVVLEEGLTISGTLVDSDGKPLVGAQLQCRGQAGGGGARVGSDGSFTILGLAPGEFALTIGDWGPGSSLVIENAAKIVAGTQGLRLVAGKGVTIVGAVLDESGGPVRNAEVSATPKKTQGPTRSAQSRADGTFEITGLMAETVYTVRATVPGRLAAKVDDAQAGAAGVNLVCASGLVATGRIVDEEGNAVKGAPMWLNPTVEGASGQQSRTGDDGRFSVSGLVAGTYHVVVQRPGSENFGSIKAGSEAGDLRPVK